MPFRSDRLKIAIVGAGPAGSLLAMKLAEGGVQATVFDASHPREKPCGGGLTGKALRELPAGPPGDPLPAQRVASCRFEAEGGAVEVPLREPVAVASRRELDAWLLRRATAAGARHVDRKGRGGRAGGGAHGRERPAGLRPRGRRRRREQPRPAGVHRPAAEGAPQMAVGWYSTGVAPMVVRFTPPLSGYLWAFPRPDHVGVGICAPLGEVPTRSLWERLEHEVARTMPALWDPEAERYAHTIPSPSADPRDILEAAGDGFALVGDAAALADPITGEGIFYALRSAALLARALLAEGSPARYPERVLADFGRDLLKAAALRRRLYAPASPGAWCDTPGEARRSGRCSATSCSASRATWG